MNRLTIRAALHQATTRLEKKDPGNPSQLEARTLLSFALGRPPSHLHAWPDNPLNAKQQSAFQQLLERRAEGEPIAYITGYREFWSLELKVTPETLIPRPETELLVEQALALIPGEIACRIADLGTGCGAIAAAIASERPRCSIIATDRSSEALAVAEGNFRRLELTNVVPRAGEWCDALPEDERFDLILSNPPYVSDGDPHLKRGDLPWEPRSALAGGPDGLSAIHSIVMQSPAHLISDGWLLLEHGFDQGAAVREILEKAGFEQIRTLQDMAGLDRVSKGQHKGSG